jgi:hypothetical protein
MRQEPLTETRLVLEDLTILSTGVFTWYPEAVWAESSGEIIQRGEIGGNRFTIDFGLPGAPAPRQPGILYGKE